MPTRHLNGLLRYVRRAAGAPTAEQLTDGQLLEQFAARQDEAAFETLLERHGPMVLAVCRRVLHAAHDVEDAFQATFLVLVRKAESICRRESVGGWLYQVAYHIAVDARARALKRRSRELEMSAMSQPESTTESAGRELRQVLDEELNRLPEKYRMPLVLCYLEGKTNDQAARELRWPAGSMSRRLQRGRELLRERLVRRGLVLSGGLFVQVLADSTARAAVPASLLNTTLRAAVLVTLRNGVTAGTVSAPVAALVDGALRTATVFKIKLAAALVVAVGMLTAAVSVGLYSSASPAPRSLVSAPVTCSWGKSVNGLRLHVYPDRTHYRLGGDVVNITFVVQNVSETDYPVTLARTAEERTRLTLLDAQGNRYDVPGFRGEALNAHSRDATLGPGKIARVNMILDPERVAAGLKAGSYRLRGTFQYQSPPEAARNRDAFALESNEVEFVLAASDDRASPPWPAGAAVDGYSLTLQSTRPGWKSGDTALAFAAILHRRERTAPASHLLSVYGLTYYHLEVTDPHGRQFIVPQPVALPASVPAHFRFANSTGCERVPAGRSVGERLCWDPAGAVIERTRGLDELLFASGPGAAEAGVYRVRAVYQLDTEAEREFNYRFHPFRLVSNTVDVRIAADR